MKIIQIGQWDGQLKEVELKDNQTVNDALKIAGIKRASTQVIVTQSNAENIEDGELPESGETYLLTSNQESGY